MSNRRISASNSLAPVQELAVQPFSTYNSDSVNKITRIVTGLRDKDIVVGGLDVQGNPDSSTTLYGSTLIDDDFTTLSTNWSLVGGDFVYDVINGNILATSPTSGSTNFEMRYQSRVADPTIYKWYEIKFTLATKKDAIVGKGTPRYIYVSYGGHTETYSYAASGIYTLMVQAENSTGELRLTLSMDYDNPFNPDECTIDDVSVKEVTRQGGYIEPIIDQTVDQDCIHAAWLRPHESCRVSAGVAIKDDAMINIMGIDPENKPVVELDYDTDANWIKGPMSTGGYASGAFIDADFVAPDKSGAPWNQADDGDPDNVYYCNFPDVSTGTDYKWAYICVYYSYFKNPIPNNAYIGFARDEEINDPIYGEDYLPLAKLRFTEKGVVDAIFYYPIRNDWGVIDAANTTYLLLNDLRHWETRPTNVSIALDILAARMYAIKRFEIDWSNGSEINSDSDSSSSSGSEPAIQDGDWPVTTTTKPSDWYWYEKTPAPHLANAEKVGEQNVEFTDPGTLDDTVYNNLEEAILQWPEAYYVVLGTGSGAGTTVNPNSMYGNGKVPGAKTLDVKLNKFLRADNTWQNVSLDEFELSWDDPWDPIGESWTQVGTFGDLLEDAKSVWPDEYWKVINTDDPSLPFRKVNPYNPSGNGLVPGPIKSEVQSSSFLRSDGTWNATDSAYRYYLHGWPQAGMITGKIIATSTRIIKRIEWHVDHNPDTNPLIFQIWYNGSAVGSTYSIPIGIVTNSNSDSIDMDPADYLSVSDKGLVSIVIVSTGTSPNEGGNDLTISLY